MNEQPIVFESGGLPIVGMLHPAPTEAVELGVLMMVAGGPQYRIGGHRQLILWARQMAANGFPVLRFDFKGMGDSYGEYRGFEYAEDDIRAALETLFQETPSLKRVVLWGECNACSASLFYAHKDPRVAGIVMLNPWVRTEEGQAKAVIKHYYMHRLMERAFWAKVLRLEFDFIGSFRSAVKMLRLARKVPVLGKVENTQGVTTRGTLPERMLHGLSQFHGKIMLVMSGRDLVAREFDDMLQASSNWKAELIRCNVDRHDLEFADHTFSTGVWRAQVAEWGISWLRKLARSA